MNVYAKKFVDSINKLKKKGLLKPKIKKFYNYLIVDAKSLYNLLQRFSTDETCDLKPRDIVIQDFKSAII